jgi:hypothetical protein
MSKLHASNPVCYSCSSPNIVMAPAVCEWDPYEGLWVYKCPPTKEEDKSTVSCLTCGADHNAVMWVTGEEYINSPTYKVRKRSYD